MKNIVIGISGASGSIYARRLVNILLDIDYQIDLCVTDTAKIVIKDELGVNLDEKQIEGSLGKLFGSGSAKNVIWHDINDLTASISSGSYIAGAMVVIPCSMATLSAIATGASRNLLQRAADVTLKEGRKLIVVPRETPLSAIHLENMLRLSRAGAAIIPAMPAFYHKPQKIEELVDYVVVKVLDRLGIENDVMKRWKQE